MRAIEFDDETWGLIATAMRLNGGKCLRFGQSGIDRALENNKPLEPGAVSYIFKHMGIDLLKAAEKIEKEIGW